MARSSQLMPTLLSFFPPLYERLLPAAFGLEAPDERKATCSSCAMCADGAAKAALDALGAVTFSSETKCCTYWPAMPSYLVGALLLDDEPSLADGRARIRERIATRVAVTPWWVNAPAKYWLLWEAARRDAFGRASSLRCPYYGAGGCTVWRYRQAVCSTFFCKHEAGLDGKVFWRAVETTMIALERALAEWAREAVDPATAQPSRAAGTLTREELDDQPPREADYASWWGDWVGREEAFYIACYEKVRELGPGDVERIGGPELASNLAVIAEARRALTASVPAHPKLARDLVVKELPGEEALVYSYSRYDPLVVPRRVLRVLEQLDGATPVREALARGEGVELSDDDLEALVHFRVLG